MANKKFKALDLWLFLLPISLGLIGVAGIYSITYTSQGIELAYKQGIFLLIGLLIMLIMTFIDYQTIKGFSFWIYLFSLLFLILLAVVPDDWLIVVKEFGAKRWFRIGGFQFQPSEVVKIANIILVSTLFAKFHKALSNKVLILASVIVLIPVIVVLKQPDLGTAIILVLSGIFLFFASGFSKKQIFYMLTLIVVLLGMFVLSYKKIVPFSGLLKDYQRERVKIFLDPEADPSEQGYNILQSVIAVGSGGLIGKGLGFGSQSQSHFLPVAHSDFIFASLAESWGFAGAAGIIIIYAIILSRIIIAIRVAKDRFGILLASGVFGMFLLEILINIGMNIRLFPVTGIPLPLLSYGGTSIISTLFSLGLVQSIIMRCKKINF